MLDLFKKISAKTLTKKKQDVHNDENALMNMAHSGKRAESMRQISNSSI